MLNRPRCASTPLLVHCCGRYVALSACVPPCSSPTHTARANYVGAKKKAECISELGLETRSDGDNQEGGKPRGRWEIGVYRSRHACSAVSAISRAKFTMASAGPADAAVPLSAALKNFTH